MADRFQPSTSSQSWPIPTVDQQQFHFQTSNGQNNNSDVETMDIDDAMPSTTASVKRVLTGAEKLKPTQTQYYQSSSSAINITNHSPSSNPNALNSSSPSSSTKRSMIKARRRVQNPTYICVLDTNVLMGNLNTLKSMIMSHEQRKLENKNCDITAAAKSPPAVAGGSKEFPNPLLKIQVEQLIVPWVVLQELDGLKMQNKAEATVAIKFLNEQLNLADSLVQCEPDLETDEIKLNPKLKRLTPESNDDRILECCIRLGVLHHQQPSKKVILLSNDRNLLNKALVYKIESLSMDEFIKKYVNSSTKLKYQFSSKSMSSLEAKSLETDGQSSANDVMESAKGQKRVKHDPTITSQLIVREQLNHFRQDLSRLSNQRISKSLSSVSPTIAGNSNSTSSLLDDIKLKYELERTLITFIVEKLQKEYGDKWVNIFPKFNPEAADLVTCLQMLKNHWMGVFSDYFARNPRVLELVKEMLDRNNVCHSELMSLKSRELLHFLQNLPKKK